MSHLSRENGVGVGLGGDVKIICTRPTMSKPTPTIDATLHKSKHILQADRATARMGGRSLTRRLDCIPDATVKDGT